MTATTLTVSAASRALASIKAQYPAGARGALFMALCAEQWQALTARERALFDGLRDFADAVSLLAGARVIG